MSERFWFYPIGQKSDNNKQNDKTDLAAGKSRIDLECSYFEECGNCPLVCFYNCSISHSLILRGARAVMRHAITTLSVGF